VPNKGKTGDEAVNHDSSHTEKVPILKPGTFDGTKSWREYHNRFENCAQGNHWSSTTRLQQLKNCLVGEAAAIVLKNPNSSSWTFQELVNQIDMTYGPKSKHAAILKVELRNRRRLKDEPLHILRDDISAKVFDIYGDHALQERESISVEIFTHAIGDPEMVQKLLERSPTSIAEAYQVAYNYESTKKAARTVAMGIDTHKVRNMEEAELLDPKVSEINQLKQQVSDLTTKLEAMQTPKVKRSFECHYCHKQGHTIKFCRQRLANMTCYFCEQKGHHIRECPEKKAKDQDKALK
jgi:hypothetical protein